jgi:tetratricopeptide (TPR) repeat protein
MAEERGVHNQISGSVFGNVVQARDIAVVGIAAPVAGPRSSYLERIGEIAPLQLVDREQEIAELVSFYTAADPAPSYQWWRAPAWAGKSALLSWFVLHPPAGVRVVAFFVTARYAGQNDRVAFSEVVLEQLAELLGEPLPLLLTDATREAHLLGLLARAAQFCQQRDERLVLVVDGLDEDRGVTSGPDAYSIAALLPRRPRTGLRVLLAGRSDPPVPTDIPDAHPLRDPGVVRPLAQSPHAAMVRQDAERELERLLHGTEVEQNLLGLLTAAGGGLSGADLAELTGSSAWDIDRHLGAVCGRTFAARRDDWRPDSTVYVLCHEELQRRAQQVIGVARLDVYRERLHAWADGYRQRRWPDTTPIYLLRGYFQLLQAVSDVPRSLAAATDADRHDRMLDVSGGDAAALAEVSSTAKMISAAGEPDLGGLGELAVHRNILTWRNAFVPPQTAVAWAVAGHPNRAEALARSIPKLSDQIWPLTRIAIALVPHDQDRGRMLTAQAEAAAAGITDPAPPWVRVHALVNIAEAAARLGDVDHARVLAAKAEAVARSITDDLGRAETLSAAARALALAGELDQAENVARAAGRSDYRVKALAAVANELARLGERERAFHLIDEAEAVVHAIDDVRYRGEAFASLAEAAAQAVRPTGPCAWSALVKRRLAPIRTGSTWPMR